MFENNSILTSADSPGSTVPSAFALHKNYPNPFNPVTTIRYDIAEAVEVTLTIYNALGQQVRRLVNSPHQPGGYTIIWDGKSDNGQVLASGLYIYRLQAGEFVQSRKLLLLK